MNKKHLLGALGVLALLGGAYAWWVRNGNKKAEAIKDKNMGSTTPAATGGQSIAPGEPAPGTAAQPLSVAVAPAPPMASTATIDVVNPLPE